MSRPNPTICGTIRTPLTITSAILALGLLAGCDENGEFSFLKPSDAAEEATSSGGSTKTVERDVEAPDVFSATEDGLWDGRPSLGGVWVAYPGVEDPERVIIRNTSNGKFVIGALFRRERELPGPKLQISSDAAASLGILAGAPTPLNVTALIREETEEPVLDPTEAEATGAIAAPSEVSETALDPITSAGAAIESANPTSAAPAATTAAATTAAAPKPTPPPAPKQTSSLAKPFIQIGIFSKEANAERAAKQMRGAGMLPTVKRSEINNKPFWRVVVGPAANKSELDALTKSIKAEGFSDAYPVSN